MHAAGLIDCRTDSDWLSKTFWAVRCLGVAVIANVIDESMVSRTRQAIADAERAIEADVGGDTLAAARLEGYEELRLLMRYEPQFFELLEIPELLQVVDSLLGESAVLRFQNAEVIDQHGDAESKPRTHEFHMNTPRVVPGYLLSLDTVFPLTPMGGGTSDFLVVPGSHQRSEAPAADYLSWAAVSLECPAGGMVVLDSTLWHRETRNVSASNRSFVTHQFVRSFVKPHFDFVRALGEECIASLPRRTQQLLGWDTRLPTSLQEFYLPKEQRLYRSDQG